MASPRTPSSEDIKAFRELFVSRNSIVLATPGERTKQTAAGAKLEWTYRNPHRLCTNADIFRHLCGIVSLVTSPHLANNTCHWFALDSDTIPFKEFTPPEWSLPIFNWYESKSGWVHGFGFINSELPWPVDVITRLNIEWATKLGWWPCETFPDHRQIVNPPAHCSAINLPFFGLRHVPTIRKCVIDPTEMWSKGTNDAPMRDKGVRTSDTSDEPGYWFNEALEAMLKTYKQIVPGFEYCKCGDYYQVPCPGHREMGGWPDGSVHSETTPREPLLSDKTVVFIKNFWPKFKCMHGHCDGKCSSQKKTINDWRAYFDPLRLWEFEEWQDAEMERMNGR